MLLYELANQRKEPIPFFAEMGSVNPVLLLPSGLNSTTAKMLSESITMGVGQFCTNPGLIFAINSDELNNFISELRNQAAIKRVIIRDQKLLSRSNLIFTIDLKS